MKDSDACGSVSGIPTLCQNRKGWATREIKPLLEISLGVTQLLGYLGTLNAQDPQGRYWIPGMTYEPQNPLKLDDGRTVTVNPPAFGLITYELDDNSGSNGFNTSMVQSAVWAGMLLTVGLAIVTSLMARGPTGALA